MNRTVIIGTRGSDLALWQANHIKAQLEDLGLKCRLEIIKTQGDKITDVGFDKMKGKGFFTKELEEALLASTIDLAVHSCKDLESTNPPGLTIAAFSEREEPSDMILIRKESVDKKQKFHLIEKALVGTSSNRRKALLKHYRKDIHTMDLRGNVPTRVQKLRDGKFDAIVLATAGLNRLKLDLSEFHVHIAAPEVFIPAAAQGVLAIQCRENDKQLLEQLSKLNNPEQTILTTMERKLLNIMEGGCQKPLGIYAMKKNDEIHLHAAYAPSVDENMKKIFLRIRPGHNLEKVAELLKPQHRTFSVFISRYRKEAKYFAETLSNLGYNVICQSLTRFEKIPFKGIPETEWIFFSSRKCVKYFYAQHPKVPTHVKIGSIGGATAEALINRGIEAHFTGEGPDTVAIANEFVKIAGADRVLFPMSTASYRTVQKQFGNQSQVIDMVVYDTIENERAEIPDADIVVLTSPSNAILYFRKKRVLPDQVFIPIGNSTAEILRQQGITNFVLPWNTNEIALADAVMSLG
ncbi:MAG TPA: hydroxymethylbilane synthase [Flavobacteriales bacterium]|nr:hydroxymethylbilane synthase [Flavobacteriales bacterium]